MADWLILFGCGVFVFVVLPVLMQILETKYPQAERVFINPIPWDEEAERVERQVNEIEEEVKTICR